MPVPMALLLPPSPPFSLVTIHAGRLSRRPSLLTGGGVAASAAAAMDAAEAAAAAAAPLSNPPPLLLSSAPQRDRFRAGSLLIDDADEDVDEPPDMRAAMALARATGSSIRNIGESSVSTKSVLAHSLEFGQNRAGCVVNFQLFF